jgi:hypothetical protein
MPTSGTAHYTLVGATAPTFASGAVTPGTFTGQGLVHFGSGETTRIAFKGDLVFGHGDRYHLFTRGSSMDTNGKLNNLGDSQLHMNGRTTFAGNIGVVATGGGDRLGCGSQNCQANVNGGFFGSNAAKMGVTYSVGQKTGAGDTINGVAVFKRD